MKRKAVSGVILALFLIGMLTLAFDIQPTKAGETIYIKADGSVEGTTDITTVDNIVYTFTNDISDSLVVERDDITIDGMGYTLQGSRIIPGPGNETGIFLSGRSNVTIKDVRVREFDIGIWLQDCWHYNHLLRNTVENNTAGIILENSSLNTIGGNIITQSFNVSVALSTSMNNTIYENTISVSTHVGIELYDSSGNHIFHNNFIANTVQAQVTTWSGNSWDYGYPSGGNYWNDYNGTDLYSGLNQNQNGSDGIGDTPYVINAINVDRYPLMNSWTQPHSIWIHGVEQPVAIETNTTIAAETSTGSHVHIECTGPTGETGYMLITFPIGANTTEIRVTIDGSPITPVINSNGTHYFIYFEFTLSTHNITIQFAPDWWPMFRHDLTHSGYSTSTAPDTNNTIWTYTTGNYVGSSPSVIDGKVYVGSWDYKVYCLNASTGAHIWNYTTGSVIWSSSPAVADDRVYVGSNDQKVYCLNASAAPMTADQREIWNYTTSGVVHSSPTVADSKVYIGSDDGKVYCLDASTGAHIWNYTTGDEVDGVDSTPAVVDGKVYVGSEDGKVYCLNASAAPMSADQREIWNYTIGPGMESSPAIVDGKVYVGSRDNNVYCLNATTGLKIWNYTTGWQVLSSPAVVDSRVYVGSTAPQQSGDPTVYCLDASTGAHIWNYTTGGNVFSSPAVADGKVYVGSHDDKVYCLNASTGAHIWNYTTGGNVVSSPAVADGKVYVGSNDWKVYAFGPSHDVAVTNVTTSKDGCLPMPTVGQGYNVTVNATVENQGDFTETFNVTVYANTTLIGTQTNVVLTGGNSTTFTFTWNTTGFQHGNYTITANVTIVSGEVDTSDNTYIDGQVLVSIPGDTDDNRRVDVIDQRLVQLAMFSVPGSPNWNPNADIDDNLRVDVIDQRIQQLYMFESW